MRIRHVFCWSLAITLPLQLVLWHHILFIDKDMWINHTKHVEAWDEHIFDKSVYGHPGTPPMMLAILLTKATHQPVESTFLTSLAILISLMIAGTATLSFILQPATYWWIAVTGILAVNRLYILATPPAAFESVLVAAIILLSWLIWKRPLNASKSLWWMWGALFGIAGATRADFSGFLLLALLPLFAFRLGVKRLLWPILLAVMTFAAVNPFMWHIPLQHVRDLLRVAHYHYTGFRPAALSWSDLALISPLAVVSILLGICWLMLGQRLPKAIPLPILGWLLITTAAFTWLIHLSQFQAERYFFPLLFVWETLLPLFVLSLLPSIRWQDWSTQRPARFHHVAAVAVLFLFVVGQATMFIHLYTMPEVQLLCSPFCGY